ncbi:MAG: WD40 repeat domain-containing protein [Gammaproteobacteria bacterium]|jgi:WD40 repeat protein
MKHASLPCLLLCTLCLLGACADDSDTAGNWEHSRTGLYAAAVSNDGRFAVVSSSSDGASFWDLERNERLFDWKHSDTAEYPIAHVAFSPNDSRVITADAQSFVIWDAKQGQALGYFSVDAGINAVALSNDARSVLLGLADGRAVLINQATQRRVEVIAHQGERVVAVDLSADGSIAATGGNDGRVMVWRATDGTEIHALKHSGRIAVVKFAPGDKRLFSADERGDAAIWDLDSGKRHAEIDLPTRQNVITAARFSDDGSRLLLGFPGREVRLWDSREGRLVKAWRTPDRKHGWVPQGSTVYAVAFNAANATIVAESSNGLGRAWRAASVN